ncbi:MAG: hypothetical protein ABSE62_00660 [Chthoniobacteraceae bacterium]
MQDDTGAKRTGTAKKANLANVDLPACLEYLRREVIDGEFQAACVYEYARESQGMREESALHKRGTYSLGRHGYIVQPNGQNVLADPIWTCPSFPAKGWNQLNETERAKIVRSGGYPLPPGKNQPLHMNHIGVLYMCGVFDAFKALTKKMAEESFRAKELGIAMAKPDPVLEVKEGSPLAHALFTIDFRDSREKLVEAFDIWLQLPEQQARLRKHKQNRKGKARGPKERLRDLAAWRIASKLGYGKAWSFLKKELSKTPPYGEEAALRRATGRAVRYLAELFPWES